MTRLVDLDNLTADDAVRLYEAAKFRIADPELREAIQQRATETGDEDLIAIVENALDSSYPTDVLHEFWRQIIPNRPALGAFLYAEAVAA